MRREVAGKRKDGKLESGMWAMSCQYFNSLESERVKHLTVIPASGKCLQYVFVPEPPCPAG